MEKILKTNAQLLFSGIDDLYTLITCASELERVASALADGEELTPDQIKQALEVAKVSKLYIEQRIAAMT